MQLFLYISSLQQASSISCLDENGEPVDSWTAIKGSNDFNYYVYNPDNDSWVLSPYYLNQTEGTDGCIMGTVGALYGAGSDGATYDMLGLYNDEQVSILDRIYAFQTLSWFNPLSKYMSDEIAISQMAMTPPAHMLMLKVY